MKRVLSLILTIILAMTVLTGCIIIPLFKNFEIERDTVLSVEIYDLRDCEDSSFGNFLKDTSPIYELPEDEIEGFLSELADMGFSDIFVITLAAMDPSFYYDDWVARINYTDGSFQLLSSGGYGETYDRDGNVTNSHHFGADDDEWFEFISKYLPESLLAEKTESN